MWSVTAIEAVANDRLELAALISPTGSGQENDMGKLDRPVQLTCQDGAGWVAAAPPVELGAEAVAAHLIDADAVSLRCLPGGEALAGFGTLPFGWAAGTWPTAEAAEAGAGAMGVSGTWALIGDLVDEEADQPDGDEPSVRIEGPDGKPARTSAPLLPEP